MRESLDLAFKVYIKSCISAEQREFGGRCYEFSASCAGDEDFVPGSRG